ncbi:ABC transporter substrate-binding protein [Streptomyces sp. NPDC055078]
MTDRRRPASPGPSWIARTRSLRTLPAATVTATATAVALLVSGCGVIPGGADEAREPVTVMTFAPESTEATNKPGMPAMAKAYARWVNSDGGIDGHELRVISCNERNTRVGALACARQAVDEEVDAVVGSYSQHGDSVLAPLEAAGIPFIGGFGVSEEEFNSNMSYPVNGGQATLLVGNGLQLADVCRRVTLVRPDSLAGDELPPLLNAGLASADRRSTDVPAAEDATDYTEVAGRARTKAGRSAPSGTSSGAAVAPSGTSSGTPSESGDSRPGCVTAALGERTETFFDSFRRLPPDDLKVRVSSVLGSVGQSLIDRTGGPKGVFEGAFITGWYPDAGDARWDGMERVIAAHAFGDNRIDPADAGVQTTWIAYTVLSAVVESLDSDDISPEQITEALDNGVRVTTGGLTPPLRWDYEDDLDTPGFPRIVNRAVTFQVVRDGRLVAQRAGFVDVGATLANSDTG